MCPVCTVTVIAGLGISRLLGIDDLITSLWIGAFILSFSFVTIDWINKKWPKLLILNYKQSLASQIPGKLLVIALMYLFVLIPLKLSHTIGIIRNSIWGVDKIIFGIIIGSIVFLAGAWADKYQRKKFKKIFFPFQKVVFPITCLLIASLVFWVITI